MAAQGYIMPWCNWQTGEIEVYQIPPLNVPVQISFDPSKKFTLGPIEVKIGLPPWKSPDTLPIPDYDKAKKIGTISGKDCKYKKGNFQLGHPYEMSDPIAQQIKSATHSRNGPSPSSPRAASNGPSLVNWFPYVVPLPLALPAAFDIPAGATNGGCDGNVTIYQIENDLDTVVHMSVCPQQVLNEIKVCSSPLESAVTPDGSTLLVTCYDNAIAWIDTASDKVKFTLNTPNAFPAGIAVSPDGSRAYVTNYYDFNPNASLLVIDIASHAVVNTIPMPTSFPGVVTLTPDGSQAWVNYYHSSFVDIVDTASGTVGNRIDLQEDTENGMAFNPTGTKAFIATGSNHLAVVDTATLKVITKVAVGATPLDVVVTPDGTRVLVGGYSGATIAMVDAIQNVLIQNFPTEGAMQGLGIIPIP